MAFEKRASRQDKTANFSLVKKVKKTDENSC